MFPGWGYVGLGIMVAGGLGAALSDGWLLHVYFTPWMWSGYILFIDALLRRLRGASWLYPHPGRLLILLPISLLLWLLFEAYNLHLRNWAYVGLPASHWLQGFGYVWSFATIWPALFLTADLLEALGLRLRGRPLAVGPRLRIVATVSGLLLAVIPLLLPAHLAAYTFVAVWLAYVPLIEPVLVGRAPVPTLLQQANRGEWTRWLSLGLGGLLCGLLWESWNMVSTARWIYIFPLFQDLKLFEMPLPGYLGFIPFAWEASSLYALIALILVRLFPRMPASAWFARPAGT